MYATTYLYIIILIIFIRFRLKNKADRDKSLTLLMNLTMISLMNPMKITNVWQNSLDYEIHNICVL